MRIAYTTGSIIPSAAANSVQVLRMCEALGAQGHDVTLHSADGGGTEDAVFSTYNVRPTFRLLRHKKPTLRGLGPAAYLAQVTAALLSGPRPDVVYSRGVRYLLAASALRVPLVYEAHAMALPGPRRRTREALFALPTFARVVCVSEGLRQDMLAAYPSLEAERVFVAHDAAVPIDFQSVVPAAPWPGRSGALQVGYVGGIYAGRGIEQLVEVARRLPGVDVHIVGGDAAEVPNIGQIPANLYSHGRVLPSEVPTYLARFDVLMAPFQARVAVAGNRGDTSRWMSPLKIFEYLSTGRAIVCSDMPVLREVLTDDETALLVPSADVDAWVGAVQRLEDAALRARLGAAARATFERHYTWDQRARHVLAGL
jgi:glycosyltransferase involved in cell wall biosynthesis